MGVKEWQEYGVDGGRREFRYDVDERKECGQVFGAPCKHRGVECMSIRRMIL